VRACSTYHDLDRRPFSRWLQCDGPESSLQQLAEFPRNALRRRTVCLRRD
jgi:hypothetical protein